MGRNDGKLKLECTLQHIIGGDIKRLFAESQLKINDKFFFYTL